MHVTPALSPDDAWPLIQTWAATRPSQILPGNGSAGADTLGELQVTTQSVLGALAYHCGGIIADDGWLRILGGGYDGEHGPGMPSLTEMNGLAAGASRPVAPGLLVVAYDILGGLFGVNSGALSVPLGEVAYFGPDTLEWVPLGAGHAAFVEWALTVGLEDFAGELRWKGWRDETAGLPLDTGIAAWPPPWSHEGRSIGNSDRSPALLTEIWAAQAKAAQSLAGPGPATS